MEIPAPIVSSGAEESRLQNGDEESRLQKNEQARVFPEKQYDSASQISAEKLQEARMDGGWRAWCAVLSSFLQFAICLGGPNAFGVFQAEYSLVQFPGTSDLMISFIGGTTLALLVVTCLAVGRLCELRGPRFVAIIGTVITVAGLLAASWCRSVPALIATQGVVQGIGGGCIFVAGTSIVPPWFVKRRALAMGIASSGLGAGGIAWSYIYRACIGSLGYQWTLRISAFITIAIMAIAILIIRSPAASRKASKTGNWKTAFRIYKQEPWLISYWLAFFIFFFGFSTPQFYLPQYIQTLGGATPSQGAGISAVINAGAIVGRVVMGFMGDSRVGIMNMFCIGIVLAGILQAVMWLPANGNLPTSFVFALLYGATGVGAIGVAPAVLAVHLDPSKLASLIGVFFTCEIAGFLTGPSIAGAILARADYRAVIGYSCGAMILGSAFAILARFQIAKGVLLAKV